MSNLPVYKKALDIIFLTRSISNYLRYDLSGLSYDGKEDSAIYFSGDIIQQSNNLAPEIINIERERFSEKKHKHMRRLDKLLFRLNTNCKRLERSKSNGKDYIPILKREIKAFRKLKRIWMLTL